MKLARVSSSFFPFATGDSTPLDTVKAGFLSSVIGGRTYTGGWGAIEVSVSPSSPAVTLTDFASESFSSSVSSSITLGGSSKSKFCSGSSGCMSIVVILLTSTGLSGFSSPSSSPESISKGSPSSLRFGSFPFCGRKEISPSQSFRISSSLRRTIWLSSFFLRAGF